MPSQTLIERTAATQERRDGTEGRLDAYRFVGTAARPASKAL